MTEKHTPLMTQYLDIRSRYNDGILFFQVGDFYETFYEDAKKVSRLLNIALTSRDKKNPVPLAGVPVHAVEAYVAKLLQAGEKVVICDQVEDPSEAKGIVKREVTDVITPGTSLYPATLKERENNYVASVVGRGERCGFALMDLSTGDFSAGEDHPRAIENMLAGYQVREAIFSGDPSGIKEGLSSENPCCAIEDVPDYMFNERESRESLARHFRVSSLSCFGIEDRPLAMVAAGALLSYVKELRKRSLEHISTLRLLVCQETLFLDPETIRNLEIFEPLRGNAGETTLVHHIDRTKTSAGGREIRKWLTHPSRVIELIEERLDGVGDLISDQIRLRRLRVALEGMPDIERILSRVTSGKAGPRELLHLAEALERSPETARICDGLGSKLIRRCVSDAITAVSSTDLIRNGIAPDSPQKIKDGGYIKMGFDSELDALIAESEQGRRWIAALQESEREKTGIPSLKVGYNKVFGYYIEVSRLHEDKVPKGYIGKQTLVSSQRYVTEPLKEKENLILNADSRRSEMEREIFDRICSRIAGESEKIQRVARGIAILDTLTALADLALERGYCRPMIDQSLDMNVTAGRHPVVEIISEDSFVPNDITMHPDKKQLLLITGPNMGGKSTYIRQAALIAIMAHMGSYVPASRARMGVMDRIFTRVGSSDNLAKGQSTFLVEMGETAKILNNCTSRSLVLLDEIGRGTGTLDGLSLAWAVTEYLLEDETRRPKTLFATHFHELTALSAKYPRIQNMKVDIREWGNTIVFLHRILEGKSDKSYGIHVAQMAGLPSKVIERAWEIFRELEDSDGRERAAAAGKRSQTDFLDELNPLKEKLSSLDIDNLTPMEALRLLAELRKISRDSR